MASINNLRRFYLHKWIWALRSFDNTAAVWRSKQEALPGVALAATFPHLSKLTECGYTTEEDLDGADEAELLAVGFTTTETEQILAAL